MKRLFCCILCCLLAFGAFACAAPEQTEAAQADTVVATESAAETAAPVETPAPTVDPNQAISFDDEVLEGKLREIMGKPTGDILVSDALAVTELDLSMDGGDWSKPRISSIDALKYFTNLKTLFMNWALYNGGKGVDLKPLSGLTKLEGLTICCDDIYDISPLAPLVNITGLWIWGCRHITDISALSGMTRMTDLWIKGNVITDISPLSGMKNLDKLYMEENMVTDLTPLANLTNLKSLLLSNNPISDYSVLSGIYTNLVEKDFEPVAAPQPIVFNDAVLEKKVREALEIPEGDITILQTKSVDKLLLGNEWQEVIPDDVKISDIGALRYFPNLQVLELYNNNVSDLYVLPALKNLTVLEVNSNPVYQIYPLGDCKQLTKLNISSTNINGDGCLAPLAELTQLEWLDLSYIPGIGDVNVLSGLTSLKSLYMNGIPVDLTPLAGLTNLTTLYLPEPFEGKYNPDYSVLKDIYPNLTDKNFEIPQG